MKRIFFTFLLILSCQSIALAKCEVAVVDLSKIVGSSSQVKQLMQEHKQKLSELDRVIVDARSAIAKESDSEKISILEEKYMREFNSKKDNLEKEYNNRLLSIEKNIHNDIVKKAQKNGYKYVFAKSVVMFGGDDITDEIMKKK